MIVGACLLLIAAFVSAVRCCYRANDAKGPANVRKEARRSFRKDEEIGTIAIPIASNIRVLHDDDTKHLDNEDTRSISHKSIATHSTRSTAEKSAGSRCSKLLSGDSPEKLREAAFQQIQKKEQDGKRNR